MKSVKPVSAAIEDAKAGKTTKVEAAKKIVTEPVVIGAAVCTVGSIGCNIASRKVSEKIIGDLTSAYTMSQSLNALKDAAMEKEVGPEKAAEIKQKAAEEVKKIQQSGQDTTTVEAVKDSIVITGHGNVLFRDYESGRYFRASKDFIDKCVEGFRNALSDEFYMSLNDLYALIGLDNTGNGDRVGWASENRNDIRAIYDPANSPWDEPCFEVHFIPDPWLEYDKFS